MKKCFLWILLFIANGTFSQSSIKDTLIDSTTYRYAHYRLNGKLKALSQNPKKRNGGVWLFFNRKGEIAISGEYNKRGKREGNWWYNRNEFIEYRNGKKTGKKGIGCLGCPPF